MGAREILGDIGYAQDVDDREAPAMSLANQTDIPSNAPAEPGIYDAREVIYGLGQSVWRGSVEKVEVVAGVPNARNHKLLVKISSSPARYKGLACYDWSKP